MSHVDQSMESLTSFCFCVCVTALLILLVALVEACTALPQAIASDVVNATDLDISLASSKRNGPFTTLPHTSATEPSASTLPSDRSPTVLESLDSMHHDPSAYMAVYGAE